MKTYNQVLKLWLNNKHNLKIQSKQRYESIIKNHIQKNIGKYKIKQINTNIIYNYFSELKSISSYTKCNILYIIKSSLNYAYKNKYCNYIDFSTLKISANNHNIFVFSKEEQKILECYLKEHICIHSICILICLYTGLRIGEVCGLKWEDINFTDKYLSVKRTIIRIRNTNNNDDNKTILIASSPKSDTSNRIIPIPNFIINMLYSYKSCSNYYILSNNTNKYDTRLLEYYYKRVLNNCNIPIHKFHTLRHTFATRCIESKMDLKTLSEILGHSSIEMTLKLYVHPSYELKKNSIEELVSFMND